MSITNGSIVEKNAFVQDFLMSTACIIVAGPTASGKSSLALHLAQMFKMPIVCADSLQLYQGLPLLTAQPSAKDHIKTLTCFMSIFYK